MLKILVSTAKTTKQASASVSPKLNTC